VKPLEARLLRYARATRAYVGVTVLLGLLLAVLIVAQATLLADGITAVFLYGAGVHDLAPTLIRLALVVAARAASPGRRRSPRPARPPG
jgi:ATP-binding cassette subfamily C protein CydD